MQTFKTHHLLCVLDMLQRKDEQIVSLLLEKMKLFREMCGSSDDAASAVKMLFRANNEDVPKGEPIMMDALKEGKKCHQRLQLLPTCRLKADVLFMSYLCLVAAVTTSHFQL